MDRLIAFEEVVASEAIEFVDSSNVVFFLPAETDGVLYVGFSDSFLPESDPAPLATTEYFGATSWGVRIGFGTYTPTSSILLIADRFGTQGINCSR